MTLPYVHDLLARGYFPKELPPTFSTEGFADRVIGRIGPLPVDFTNKRTRTHTCHHSFARVGNLRRQLAIPNPITQYNLSVLIGRNWGRLERLIRRSKLSQSVPVPGDTRAFPLPTNNLVGLRALHRGTARFTLNADIARFYHSVYTHSIPWALHGKAVAKGNRSYSLLGNALDHWVRAGQDGQTMGLPIGPDTSLILAEVLLSAVDRQLSRKLPRVRGFRFMDDYELTFASRTHAEIALRHLQAAMADFELALNSEKTAIDELPCLLDPSWKTELRAFRFRTGPRSQQTDLVSYFDRAYTLSRANKGKSVLSYAIQRLRSVEILSDNWPLLQSLLSQCILIESGAFSPAILMIAEHNSSGHDIDADELTKVMNMQMAYHAPLGHGSEVAWALWACISFQLTIVRSAGHALSKMNDSVVALLALHARESGRFQRQLEVDNWRTYLSTEDLSGPQWLLCYEASVKGWLRSFSGVDHISHDENFLWLRDSGVEFYDRSHVLTLGGGPDDEAALLYTLRQSVAGSLGEYDEEPDESEEPPEPPIVSEDALARQMAALLSRPVGDDDLPF